jgi:hypothetical protein
MIRAEGNAGLLEHTAVAVTKILTKKRNPAPLAEPSATLHWSSETSRVSDAGNAGEAEKLRSHAPEILPDITAMLHGRAKATDTADLTPSLGRRRRFSAQLSVH